MTVYFRITFYYFVLEMNNKLFTRFCFLFICKSPTFFKYSYQFEEINIKKTN